MELHMREQSRQVDQERWRLSQEESRLKAQQAALEDERRITMEQLSVQRAEVILTDSVVDKSGVSGVKPEKAGLLTWQMEW